MNKFITAMRKNRRLTVLFSAFMFIQFIILRMSNQAGRGFLRMNTACPRAVLEDGLKRLKTGTDLYYEENA